MIAKRNVVNEQLLKEQFAELSTCFPATDRPSCRGASRWRVSLKARMRSQRPRHRGLTESRKHANS